MPAGTYGLREDRMLYLVVADKVTFTAAKELCRKIPGHRLAIMKTIKQYKILQRISYEKSRQASHVPKATASCIYRVSD